MLGGTAVLAAATLLLAVRGGATSGSCRRRPRRDLHPLAYEGDPGTGWAVWLFLPLALGARTAAVPRRAAPGEYGLDRHD